MGTDWPNLPSTNAEVFRHLRDAPGPVAAYAQPSPARHDDSLARRALGTAPSLTWPAEHLSMSIASWKEFRGGWRCFSIYISTGCLATTAGGFSPGSLQPRGSSLQQMIPHNSPYNKKHVLILALLRDRARIHDSLYFATAGGILVGLKKKTNANYFSPPIPLRCPKFELPVETPINTMTIGVSHTRWLSCTDSWRNTWNSRGRDCSRDRPCTTPVGQEL